MKNLLIGGLALAGLAAGGLSAPTYERDIFADADRDHLFEPMQVEMAVAVDTEGAIMSDGEPVEEFFFHLALEDEIQSWISLNTVTASVGNTTIATKMPADYSTLE